MFEMKDTVSIGTAANTSIIVMILPRLIIKYWNIKLPNVINKKR